MDTQDLRDIAIDVRRAKDAIDRLMQTFKSHDTQKFASIIDDLHHARAICSEAYLQAYDVVYKEE